MINFILKVFILILSTTLFISCKEEGAKNDYLEFEKWYNKNYKKNSEVLIIPSSACQKCINDIFNSFKNKTCINLLTSKSIINRNIVNLNVIPDNILIDTNDMLYEFDFHKDMIVYYNFTKNKEILYINPYNIDSFIINYEKLCQ